MHTEAAFTTNRRGFMGRLAAAAAILGLGAPAALSARPRHATSTSADPDFEAWLNGITGKHRQIFDAVEPNNAFSLVFTRVWLATLKETYSLEDRDLNAVIVFRHSSIPLVFGDAIWSKYKFGEDYKINDPATKQPALRNPYAHAKEGELIFPDMAVEKLLDRGVKMGVCNVALTARSGRAATAMGLDKDAVKKEWVAGLLPGVIVVPSGVLAVHRAQEHGCTYCYAG